MPKYNINTNNAAPASRGGTSDRPTMPAVLSLDKSKTLSKAPSFGQRDRKSRKSLSRSRLTTRRGRFRECAREERKIVEFN